MNNKIAIQMDDIKTIDYAFDSSFMIGLEGQKRNYEIFYYHPNDLYIDNGVVKARGFYIELYEQDKNYFKFKWQVEKNAQDGPTKDCWLTTGVSQPFNLGSSI